MLVEDKAEPAPGRFEYDASDGLALQAKAIAKTEELLARPAKPSADAASAVQIVCRVRPLLTHEREWLGKLIEGATATSHAQFDYDAVVAHGAEVFCLSEERKIGVPTGEIAVSPFALHGAYGGGSSTEELYAASVAPLVALACGGGMGSVIAYGQTGSGKTHTMRGLQQLAAAELLAEAARRGQPLRLSFFENSGERCADLLTPGGHLALRDDGNGAVVVAGLSEAAVGSLGEFDRLVAAANALRATQPTASNDASSRSHAVCTLRLPGAEGGAEGGRLQLVDLAGSERREDAVAHDAARLAEMRAINASLGTLKECIRAQLRRAQGEPNVHVPYRDSKLTMLLRGAFEGAREGGGGDAPESAGPPSAVCLVAHVSPLRSDAKHSLNSLQYAAQMLQATMAERQRATFDELEKWSAKRLTGWVGQLEGGRYAHCAHAFARCSGKALSVEFLPDVAQWVVAAGGSAEDAERIYDAFRALHKKAKAAARKRQPPAARS